MLLSAGTEGDGLRVISRLLLINTLKHSSAFLHSRGHPRATTLTHPRSSSRHLQDLFSPRTFLIFFLRHFFPLTLFVSADFLFSNSSRRSEWLPAGAHSASEGPPHHLLQSAPHKSNKTRLCKYFSGFGTPSRVPLLAVCWPSVRAIVWPMADCFVLCAAGHGWSVVGRQQCLHACSGRGED